MARFVAKIGQLKVGEGTARLQRSHAPTPEVSLADSPPRQAAWHLQGKIISTGIVSLFYKVDDTLEAWLRHGSFLPYRREIRIDESNERATRRALYDHSAGFTHFWRDRTYYRRKRHKEIITIREDPLEAGSFEPVSLLLKMRCVEAEVGKTITAPLHENGKNYTIIIEVETIETIRTPLGRFEAIRARIRVMSGDEQVNKRPFIAWISNDERRIPLKAVADLPFANLKGVIAGYRRSFEAKIEGELDMDFHDHFTQD